MLDAAIKPETKNPALWLVRAEIRLQTGAFEGALVDCNRGLALVMPEKGVTVLVGGEEGERSAIGASLRLRGLVRSRLGDWPGAAKDFGDAALLQPNDGQMWRNKGAAAQNQGRLDEAIVSLSKAVDLHDEGEAGSLVLRSQAHHLTGSVAAARADLERAAKLATAAPDLADVELNRAVLEAASGDPALAGAACDRVRAADPTLAGWVALLRWSVAKPAEREAATKRLREDFSAVRGDDALVSELFRLSADGVGDIDGLSLAGRDTTARCPMWFFGGCRSAQLGRDAEARQRFLRCVNTGRTDYAQWRIALARLRSAAGKQPLRPGLGMTVEAVRDAKVPRLRVKTLAVDGAAQIQGLQLGDELLAVCGEPATVGAFGAMTKWVTFGTSLRLQVVRAGSASFLAITVGVEP